MEMVRKDQTATNMYNALLLIGIHSAIGLSHASHTRRGVLVALLQILTVHLEAFKCSDATWFRFHTAKAVIVHYATY